MLALGDNIINRVFDWLHELHKDKDIAHLIPLHFMWIPQGRA